MDLFRREALDGQDRLHGDIVFVPQISWQMLAAFFAASVAVAVLFLLTAQYRPASPVAGRLAGGEGSLIALFEVPAQAAEAVAPGEALVLSVPGTSRRVEARISAVVPSRAGWTIVRAALDGDAASAASLRAGTTVRAALRARPRPLAEWLYDALARRRRE